MSKHTKGPWEAHAASLSNQSLVVTAPADGDGFRRICVVRAAESRSTQNDAEDIPNARLIAAAPDLLEYARLENEWRFAEGDAFAVGEYMRRYGITGATVDHWLSEKRTAAIAKAAVPPSVQAQRSAALDATASAVRAQIGL